MRFRLPRATVSRSVRGEPFGKLRRALSNHPILWRAFDGAQGERERIGVKETSQNDQAKAIFGYSCLIDVSGRGEGRRTWRSGSWMGKSFDTFAPLGPCIVTADEITEPKDLEVRFWNTGELLHQYNTNDMEHRVPELIEFATAIMTMNSGDVIACGTNHEGLGHLQDGDLAEIEVQGIGRMSVNVADPLKRSWEREVYMGPETTAQSG